MKSIISATSVSILVVVTFAVVSLAARSGSQVQAKEVTVPKSEVVPVESNPHEFMEYLFQPTFNQLKASMAKAPADSKGWKPIKSGSLILAEGSNLLLTRKPADNAEEWAKQSVAVRESAADMYRAGKKKDFATARTHYEAMVVRCNNCHETFAGGEHMLKP